MNGKGSARRPSSVSDEEFGKRWDEVFADRWEATFGAYRHLLSEDWDKYPRPTEADKKRWIESHPDTLVE